MKFILKKLFKITIKKQNYNNLINRFKFNDFRMNFNQMTTIKLLIIFIQKLKKKINFSNKFNLKIKLKWKKSTILKIKLFINKIMMINK